MKAGEKIRAFALEFRGWRWPRRLMAIMSLPYVLLGILGAVALVCMCVAGVVEILAPAYRDVGGADSLGGYLAIALLPIALFAIVLTLLPGLLGLSFARHREGIALTAGTAFAVVLGLAAFYFNPSPDELVERYVALVYAAAYLVVGVVVLRRND